MQVNVLVKSLYSSETGFKFISKPKYTNRISLNMSYTRKNSSAANILRLNEVNSSVKVGNDLMILCNLLFVFSIVTINQWNWHFCNYNGSHSNGTYNLKDSGNVAYIQNLHFLTTYAIMFKAQV